MDYLHFSEAFRPLWCNVHVTSQLNRADVVLYHAPTHHMHMLHSAKRASKAPKHVLLSMEQPKYATVLSQYGYLRDHFDLLVTYSLSPIYPKTTWDLSFPLTTFLTFNPPHPRSIPNLPVTYYPLNILPIHAVMKPPKPFSEKNGYGKGMSPLLYLFLSHRYWWKGAHELQECL